MTVKELYIYIYHTFQRGTKIGIEEKNIFCKNREMSIFVMKEKTTMLTTP